MLLYVHFSGDNNMKYRKRLHKNKLKKHRKIIIISLFVVSLCLSIGYSAFNTNLTFNTKGNIKELTAAHYLKTKATSSGNGLYKDIYQNNRYVYKGINPNNYLKLNNVLYRIVAIEPDGTLKIIKN